MNRRETGVCSQLIIFGRRIMAVNKENPSDSIRPHLIALLAIFLLSLVIWSCQYQQPGRCLYRHLQLDSARVGKFDSVMVQIYNGKAPGPGGHQPSRADGSDQGDAHYQGSHRGAQFQGEEGFLRGDTGFSGGDIAYEPAHRGRLRRRQHQAGRALISRIDAEDLTLGVGRRAHPP